MIGPADLVPGGGSGVLPSLRTRARGSAGTRTDPLDHEPAFSPQGSAVPHVIAWNLTRRCNLACSHCYISAGSWHAAAGELGTDRCVEILDQLLEVNPNPMLILSGGEPLLRDDLEILAAHASGRGATVVVGTNGTRLTDARIESLMEAGVSGVAISIDSLEERYHDRFRHGAGALADTLAAVERLGQHRLDFLVQTTLTRGNRHELGRIAEWAADRGAISLNVYFLVATGRGQGMSGLAPEENEAVLAELVGLERTYRGRMMVRSKCQPQIMRHVVETDPDSPLLNYRTRCPCGVQYCRITPEGKVTPCPYTPVVAGDLAEQDFRTIWEGSPVFHRLRSGALGGRCGRCEYREVCGGCRARAHAESGDLMGPDDSCAYEPPQEVQPPIRTGRAATYGSEIEASLEWTEAARARLDRIPSFVRGVVTSRVEAYARERGIDTIDEELMVEVRQRLPGDFSKRLPFFFGRGNRPDRGGEA